MAQNKSVNAISMLHITLVAVFLVDSTVPLSFPVLHYIGGQILVLVQTS